MPLGRHRLQQRGDVAPLLLCLIRMPDINQHRAVLRIGGMRIKQLLFKPSKSDYPSQTI